MKLLRLRLDFQGTEDIGKMTVFQIVAAYDSKDFSALHLFLSPSRFRFGEEWSFPKFLDFEQTDICLKFIWSIFDHLIKLIRFYFHIIGLYYFQNQALHLFFFLNELYHQVEDVRANIPPEFLLWLFIYLWN